MLRIPLFSVIVDSWQLSSHAFRYSPRSYRAWQQRRSCLSAIINPCFAAKWFAIFKSPDFLPIATHRERLYFKPFRVYMSTRWTKMQRMKVILDTYRFIISKNEAFMQVVTHTEGIEIARFNLDDTIEGLLKLGYDDTYRKEGELVLSFECNELGGMIAAAAFSFEEMEEGRWVCRIACIQGHKINNENSSKIAQKLMHALRPKSLVIFAVQEFSRHLGFTAVYGAGDAIQVYRRKHLVYLPSWHAIRFDYNATWSEADGQPDSNGWYKLPLTPVRKNIHEIKSNKRSLYHKRYSLLDDLSLKIADAAKKLSRDDFS